MNHPNLGWFFFVYCDIIKLDLNFETLAITLGSGLGNSKYDNSDCANDINKIDIIKIEEMEFVVGCIKNDNQIKIDIITVDSNYNSINTKSFTLNIMHQKLKECKLIFHSFFISSDNSGHDETHVFPNFFV